VLTHADAAVKVVQGLDLEASADYA